MSDITLESVSVVIATLGGKELAKTINSVISGTIVPCEILICIPKEYLFKVKNIKAKNISFVITSHKGQVYQRAEGFKASKTDYILQLDDDIQLDSDALEIMLKGLRSKGVGNVVGPSFYDPVTLKALHQYDVGIKGFLKSVNASVFSAASWGVKRMGELTGLGIAYGVNPNITLEKMPKVGWLPGGCVLNYKQDLIEYNFFPLPGKAFSEDVIHSLLRIQNGMQHYVALCASVKTKVDESGFVWSDFRAELKARYYVVELMRGNKIRFYLWGGSQLLIRLLSCWRIS